MKKKIISLLLVLSAFLITSGVSAKEMSKDDIKPGTYMIGTHLFTRDTAGEYDGTLTVRYIMLAARTINSANIDDMIIYLKNSRGKWVNAVTNEEVTVPNKVDIYYENSVEEFLPTIGVFSYLDIVNGQWWFEPFIDAFDGVPEKEYEFELYEKTSSGYEFVGSSLKPNSSVIPWGTQTDATNEVKTYVGRLAITNSKGEKIYSDYSDEVTVDTKNELAVPNMISELNIQYDSSRADWFFNMYLDEEFKNKYPSDTRYNFELSEKTSSGYVYVDDAFTEGMRGKDASADISNETKTYVARLYIKNSEGGKIYSNYSEELTLSLKDSIPTPEIFYECDMSGCSVNVDDFYFRTSCNNSSSCSSTVADKLIGNYYYNVYEKNGNKIDNGYALGATGKTAIITDISNEAKTYVAKLYLTNSKGEEVFSKESNEITISAKDILGKPELVYSYDMHNGNVSFETILGSEYVTDAENAFDYDIELYTKNNGSYNLVDTKTYNTATGRGTIDIAIPSLATTYVVRVAVTNSAGKRLYGDYSDEVTVTIDNVEQLNKPVLQANLYGYYKKFNYYIDINRQDYAYQDQTSFSFSIIDGYEIYKLESGNWELEYSSTDLQGPAKNLMFDYGQSSMYKARVYAYNATGEKLYSDYSDIVTIDTNEDINYYLNNIDLKSVYPQNKALNNGVYSLYYTLEFNESSTEDVFDSWGIYEVDEENSYTLINSTTMGPGYPIKVDLPVNSTKKIKLGITISNQEFYVGDTIELNSNVFLENPNLYIKSTKPDHSSNKVVYTVDFVNSSSFYLGELAGYTISGYELYEWDGSNISSSSVVSYDAGVPAEISLNSDEKKEYVARAYVLSSDGATRIYGDYSSVLTLDANSVSQS